MAAINPQITVKVPADVKTALTDQAKIKGMDMSKLARAVLTNYVKPGTFVL